MLRFRQSIRKDYLTKVRAAIHGSVLQSLEVKHKKILPFKGEQRHQGVLKKRRIGINIRYLLLTYAFLRGKKFSQVESNRKPVVGKLLCEYSHVIHLNILYKYIMFYGNEVTMHDLTKEDVEKWILEDKIWFTNLNGKLLNYSEYREAVKKGLLE